MEDLVDAIFCPPKPNETSTEDYNENHHGKLTFPGQFTLNQMCEQKAEFIRIEKNADASVFKDYIKQKWKLEISGPILSVTGGAQNFTISEQTQTAFKQALIKVAKATDAWIVSGGSDCGVMKLVGDAVLEDLHKGTVLGIATWSKIMNHKIYVGKNKDYVIREFQY